MTKKVKKVIISFAVTAAIGGGAIGANSLLVANVIAAPNDVKPPVISANVNPSGSEKSNPATLVSDSKGKRTIICEEDMKNSAGEIVNPYFVAGTPSEKDLTETAATKAAKDAIINEFALTNETLSKFSVSAKFNVVNPKAPIWNISFNPTNQDDFSQIGSYNVTIDSLSGKIIKILSAADGVG